MTNGISRIALEGAIEQYMSQRVVPHFTNNPVARAAIGAFLKGFKGQILTVLERKIPMGDIILAPDEQGNIDINRLQIMSDEFFREVPRVPALKGYVSFDKSDFDSILELARRNSGYIAPVPISQIPTQTIHRDPSGQTVNVSEVSVPAMAPQVPQYTQEYRR